MKPLIRAALGRKTQKLFGELGVGFGSGGRGLHSRSGRRCVTTMGKLTFFGDDAAFYRVTRYFDLLFEVSSATDPDHVPFRDECDVLQSEVALYWKKKKNCQQAGDLL